MDKRVKEINLNKALYAMFTQGTGAALYDSGGAYGRHWEQNQKKTLEDFESEPAVTFEAPDQYTISTWHYLARQLDTDVICDEFNRLNTTADNWDYEGLYGVSTEAGAFLEPLITEKLSDLKSFNTANGESSLSQVLQGAYCTIGRAPYIILQLHQGCDVRGGYTDARLFKVVGECEGWLTPETVYGTATLADGSTVSVSNSYNGYSLTDDETNKAVDAVSAVLEGLYGL